MGILKRDLKPASSCKELHCSLSWPCSATGFHTVCLRGHRCQTPPHLTRPRRELRCHLRRQHLTCPRQQRQSHVVDLFMEDTDTAMAKEVMEKEVMEKEVMEKEAMAREDMEKEVMAKVDTGRDALPIITEIICDSI